ncbi:MAG: DUF1611 domain-containing protein, partial [Myxococcales bacterium]|nr:DUF1611 domain-containing protein [Myxococcales bacterium]
PNGKMGYGVLRYSPNTVVAAVDSQKAGSDMTREVGIPGGCPVVASVEDAHALGADVLVLGVANSGGFIPADWYAHLDRAVALGMSVVNGLHDKLGPRYAGKTREGQWVWDVREEPKGLAIGTGAARKLPNKRVLFVGTDMAIGKMTAALEMWKATEARGRRAEFVATGQTGITIRGRGVPLDAIRVDYATAAIERAVLEAKDAEYVFVEGQGALGHPGSTSTLPLMRGSCPTHLVLCHRAGQTAIRNLPDVPIPEFQAYVALYRDVAACAGVFPHPVFLGGCLNTAHIADEAEAREAVRAFAVALGAPATDPVRFGVAPLVDALLEG